MHCHRWLSLFSWAASAAPFRIRLITSDNRSAISRARSTVTPDGSAGVVFYANLPVKLGVRTGEGLYRFIHSGTDRGDVLVLGHQNFAGRDEQAAWDAWAAERFG